MTNLGDVALWRGESGLPSSCLPSPPTTHLTQRAMASRFRSTKQASSLRPSVRRGLHPRPCPHAHQTGPFTSPGPGTGGPERVARMSLRTAVHGILHKIFRLKKSASSSRRFSGSPGKTFAAKFQVLRKHDPPAVGSQGADPGPRPTGA